jgi:RNA polymerase sigma-70 factor, ECF subfamily
MRLLAAELRIRNQMAAALQFAAMVGLDKALDDGAEISRALRHKNVEALDRLIELYQHRLFRYLLYFTRDRQIAEDTFQETWIRVLERGKQYDPRWKFETWLISIARNLAIDQMRRKSPASLNEMLSDDDGEQVREVEDEKAVNALEEMTRAEEGAQVAVALQNMPPLYREVLALRFQEDMSLEEIARTVGIPLSTAKSRLSRGLEGLQNRLKGLRKTRGGEVGR